MAEVALVKAARALDQDGPQTVESKLTRLWDALAATSAYADNPTEGRFYAAEGVALRWLLKNMNASGTAAPEAETLRRWPLTWHILASVFRRIPLFSLAKSLADRRFIAVLQQTVQDLATPAAAASKATPSEADGNRENLRKRKRWQEGQFDLSELREPQQCIVSAAAVFAALRMLLDRLDEMDKARADTTSAFSPYDNMGAEHIKSLFRMPALESMTLLGPLLRICSQALANGFGTGDDSIEAAKDADDNSRTNRTESLRDGQATWIDIFTALWDLHSQGPADSVEVATHLFFFGCAMLGRLLNVSANRQLAEPPAFTTELQRRWTAGLQRFLINNVILPARSAYLNRKDIQTLLLAIGDKNLSADAKTAAVRSAVLLHLVLKAPRLLAGGTTSNRDNALWLRTVLDKAQEPLIYASTGPADPRNGVLADLLDMAARHDVAPSPETLRLICRVCALPSDSDAEAAADWRLIAAVANCDADAFLVSQDGEKLLDDVLQRLSPRSSSSPQSPADYQSASNFLVSLAQGFAKARNLSAFVVRWFTSMAAQGDSLYRSQVRSAWLDNGIRTAVAGILQSALTKEQLLVLLGQLEGEESAATATARLVVFDALSAGIQLEEYEDAVQMKMLDKVLGSDLPTNLPPDLLAIRWRLVRRTLSWVGFAETERIWTSVQKSLKRVSSGKKNAYVLTEDVYEALICSFSLWMALKFGGQVEQEACKATWELFKHFQDALSNLVRDDEDKKSLLQEVSRRIASYDDAAGTSQGSFEPNTASAATFWAWMLCGSSRFVDEMVKSSGEASEFLDGLLSWQSEIASKGSEETAKHSIAAALFSNVTCLQNEKITDSVTERYIKGLETSASKRGPKFRDAVSGLLRTPAHLLTRSLRRRITMVLLPPRSKTGKVALVFTIDEAVLVLDLLLKIFRGRSSNDVDFDRLVCLGEAVQAAVEPAPLRSALGALDRLQYVVTAALKSGLANTGGEDLQSIACNLQLVFLKAKLLALESIPSPKLDEAQVSKSKEKLASIVIKQISSYVNGKEDADMAGTADGSDADTSSPLPLLLAFDAAATTDLQVQLSQQKKSSTLVKKMEATADTLCSQNQKVGWKWKAFIARYAPSQKGKPAREVRFQGLFLDGDGSKDQNSTDAAYATAASLFVDSDLLRDYLAGETSDYNQQALLSYVRDLIVAFDEDEPASAVGQLLAIQYLLGRLLEMPGAATAKTADGYELGTVHSQLAHRLPRARSVTECKLMAQTLRTLLMDDKAAATAMGQWNIDTTFSSAALLVSLYRGSDDEDDDDDANASVRASTVAYDGACGLIEAVLKRHRVRLEGRFHLLVVTLQSLLTRLLAGHQDELLKTKRKARDGNSSLGPANSSADATSWVPQAKRFSRLLELVCEPSTAAVAMVAGRRGGGGAGGGGGGAAATPLHSATDAAKRSAGQHMYLVLMAYIKLQIDGAVMRRSVREALEPGLFSVLTITSDKTLRLLNDAVDASGRVLFRELYRRWLQFGKWKGV